MTLTRPRYEIESAAVHIALLDHHRTGPSVQFANGRDGRLPSQPSFLLVDGSIALEAHCRLYGRPRALCGRPRRFVRLGDPRQSLEEGEVSEGNEVRNQRLLGDYAAARRASEGGGEYPQASPEGPREGHIASEGFECHFR